MTQADCVYITPPTNMPVDTTRRHFLSNAAGLAAGGTVLALAVPPAPAAAALASSDVDPIFTRIEECRSAAKTLDAATSERSRRERMLIEQGLGLSPFISVLDVRGPGPAQAVVAYKHEYIDRHISADRFSEPNAAAHASLDAQIELYKAVLGDSEEVQYAAMDAESAALDTLIWTPPTTMPGVLALLELWSEIVNDGAHLDNDQTDALIISVREALRYMPQAASA